MRTPRKTWYRRVARVRMFFVTALPPIYTAELSVLQSLHTTAKSSACVHDSGWASWAAER